MPINDSDGTAVHPIAAVYDSDGTVNTPIAAAYDSDGTVHTPVWSSQTLLYDRGWENTELVDWSKTYYCIGGGAVSFLEDHIAFAGYNDPETNLWSRGCIWSEAPLDMTGYSSLCVQIDQTDTAIIELLLETESPVRTDNPAYEAEQSVQSAQPGVLRLDLTGQQGLRYVGVSMGPDGSWYASGSSTVSRIWLE